MLTSDSRLFEFGTLEYVELENYNPSGFGIHSEEFKISAAVYLSNKIPTREVEKYLCKKVKLSS